jgi:hypothetical protein
MCNQTVGLIAAELERHGIPTVVIQILRMVAEKVGPPRSLCVPYKHGYPLGEPNNPDLQHQVIEAALSLFERADLKPPAIIDYQA